MRRARVIDVSQTHFCTLPITSVCWPQTSVHLLVTFGGSVLWRSQLLLLTVLLSRLVEFTSVSLWPVNMRRRHASVCLSVCLSGVKVKSFPVWMDNETQRKQMRFCASKSRRSEYGLLLSSGQTCRGQLHRQLLDPLFFHRLWRIVILGTNPQTFETVCRFAFLCLGTNYLWRLTKNVTTELEPNLSPSLYQTSFKPPGLSI